MLKIALIGYGKMGKMVEKQACARNHEIVSIIDPAFGNTEISYESIRNANICIDFSCPESVLKNIRCILEFKKNLVIGTTGWSESIDTVKQWVAESQTGLFYASNFSLGVNLFLKTVETAAVLYHQTNSYDIAGMEIHHNQKLDAPSGTALEIQQAIAKSIDCAPSEIPFSSVRCGSVPGTHSIYFDSPADTITLTHQARNRDDFSLGAIIAAEWIHNKKGVYTMKDLLCLS